MCIYMDASGRRREKQGRIQHDGGKTFDRERLTAIMAARDLTPATPIWLLKRFSSSILQLSFCCIASAKAMQPSSPKLMLPISKLVREWLTPMASAIAVMPSAV